MFRYTTDNKYLCWNVGINIDKYVSKSKVVVLDEKNLKLYSYVRLDTVLNIFYIFIGTQNNL